MNYRVVLASLCASIVLASTATASAQHRVSNLLVTNRDDDWNLTQQQRIDPNSQAFVLVTTSQSGGWVEGQCMLTLSATGDVLASTTYGLELNAGNSAVMLALGSVAWPNAATEMTCVPNGFPGGAFTRSLHAGFYTQMPWQGGPSVPENNTPASRECSDLRAVYHYADVGQADSHTADAIRTRRDTACAMNSNDTNALYWPNGQLMRDDGLDGAWYYPNGQTAFEAGADGAGYYPNGQMARTNGADGARYYPNGQLARERGYDSQWYLPNGQPASANDVIAWACSRTDSAQCGREMRDIQAAAQPSRDLWIIDFAYRANR